MKTLAKNFLPYDIAVIGKYQTARMPADEICHYRSGVWPMNMDDVRGMRSDCTRHIRTDRRSGDVPEGTNARDRHVSDTFKFCTPVVVGNDDADITAPAQAFTEEFQVSFHAAPMRR